MNKQLENIKKRSRDIYKDFPKKLEALTKQLTEARKELSEAKAAMDSAEDLNSYDAASETLKRAELKVKFAERDLNNLNMAPRMTESEYMTNVGICQGVVASATEEYRQKAFNLMEQLKAERDRYLETVAEANTTLIELDQAANILQTKYTNHVTTLQGVPDISRPDPREWERHAVRYTPADAARMGTESRGATDSYKVHDSILTFAWMALSKGFPHHIY